MKRAGILILLLMLAGLPVPARADLKSTGFEPPAFSPGSVNGQSGWQSTGPYDQEITKNGNEYPGFGLQSLRMSNTVTSGSFGDQTFSTSTSNEAGETDAVAGGFSGGARLRRFDAQWDFASFTPNVYQPGLSIGVSPDRGDGARMSAVQMRDAVDGLAIDFSEYRSGYRATGCSDSNFRTVQISAKLSRAQSHSIRILIDFLDGPHNDIVRVYVDNFLRVTGTSWEDYFRECEGPGSRTVDSLLFRSSGAACSACMKQGFVFDNVQARSLGVQVNPPGPLNVAEGGSTATYSVALETAPSSVVRVIPSPGPGLTVSPNEYSFNSSDYNIPKAFTVTAIDDSLAEPVTTTTITHSVASLDGHYDSIPVTPVIVSITDNDGEFVLNETDGITVLAEAGVYTDLYSFSLVKPPSSDVTITATPDSQVTVTPVTRTFTPANWNVPQTFTARAVNDTVIEGTHSGVISHAATSTDPDFGGQPVPSVTATIYDDDPTDTTPPAPPVITNCPALTVTDPTLLLTGTSEPGTAIEAWIDGVIAGSVATDGAGAWEIALRFSSNGAHSITVRAVDGSGNFSAFSAACAVTVSADFTPPPAPTITTPAQNAVTAAATTVRGSGYGDTAEIHIFDGGLEIADLPAAAGPWALPSDFATGVHKLTARAIDAAGNLSALSAVRTFTADGTPPVVTNFSPAGTVLIQLGVPLSGHSLHGTATDALSGVQKVDVTYTDEITGIATTRQATCGTCPSAPGAQVSWADPSPGLLPGLYQVTITGTDRVGNAGTAGVELLFIA